MLLFKQKKFVCNDFSVERNGFRIAGTKFTPAEGGNHIPVIVSHGFLGNRRSVNTYAETLAAAGYTAYSFDFVGGGPKNGSDGSMADMSLLTEKADLIAVMGYVQRDVSVAAEKLILMGCSQGGLISALVAAENSAAVQKLILFYPALCIPDDAGKGRMLFFRFNPADVPQTVSVMNGRMCISREYIESAQKLDTMDTISLYKGDVLLVHGTADRIVNYSYAQKAFDVFSARPSGSVQLLPVQGADHGFKKQQDELAKAAVMQFLLEREEILTVDVRVSKPAFELHGAESRLTIPFDGFARSRYFEGVIQPGAKDTQIRKGVKPVNFCADYTIRGADYAGQACMVHIVNRTCDGINWVPSVETDSRALSFLNTAECTALLESRKTGPLIHIYAVNHAGEE